MHGWCGYGVLALSLAACNSTHQRADSGSQGGDASLDGSESVPDSSPAPDSSSAPDAAHDLRDASVDARVSPSQTLLDCDVPEPCAGQDTRWYSGESNHVEAGMSCVMRGLALGTPGRYVVSYQLLSAGPTPTTTYVLMVGSYVSGYSVTYTDGTDQTWRCAISSTSDLFACADSLDAGAALPCARGPMPWVSNCEPVVPECPVLPDAGSPDAGDQCQTMPDVDPPSAHDQLVACETPTPCPTLSASSVEGALLQTTNVDCTLIALRDRVPGTYLQQRRDAWTNGSSQMDQVIVVHADGSATYARKALVWLDQGCHTATSATECKLKPADYFNQCLTQFHADAQAGVGTTCVLAGLGSSDAWLEDCVEATPHCE